jgi:hypothetical protein
MSPEHVQNQSMNDKGAYHPMKFNLCISDATNTKDSMIWQKKYYKKLDFDFMGLKRQDFNLNTIFHKCLFFFESKCTYTHMHDMGLQ